MGQTVRERIFDSILEKGKKTGRPRILHEDHESVILECIDENLFSRPRRTRLQPRDRNGEEMIQERLDWSRKWDKVNMNFTRNCVFLDESAFHTNLKRSIPWSKKSIPAVVAVPKTRTATTTILGTISAEGLIKCSLRLPQPPSNKKRKRGDDILNCTRTEANT